MTDGYSLREIARILNVQPYRLEYQRKCGRIPDRPRMGTMMVYSAQDMVMIAELLGVEVPFKDHKVVIQRTDSKLEVLAQELRDNKETTK